MDSKRVFCGEIKESFGQYLVEIIINYPTEMLIEGRIKLLNQVINMVLDYEGVLYSEHSLLASFKNYERAEIFKMTVEVEMWEEGA